MACHLGEMSWKFYINEAKFSFFLFFCHVRWKTWFIFYNHLFFFVAWRHFCCQLLLLLPLLFLLLFHFRFHKFFILFDNVLRLRHVFAICMRWVCKRAIGCCVCVSAEMGANRTRFLHGGPRKQCLLIDTLWEERYLAYIIKSAFKCQELSGFT